MMSSRGTKVRLNPNLLKWARKSSGFSLKDLAHHFRSDFKNSEDVIRSWESGDASPTFRQLEKYAKKVGRPLTVFFLPEPPFEPKLPKDFRRRVKAEIGKFQPPTLKAFREARVLLAETIELLELLDTELSLKLPSFTLDDNPETEAAEFRAHIGISIDDQLAWKDKYEALDKWRAMLFKLGVLVFHFPMYKEDASGFTLTEDNLGVIGLSTKDDPKARCFTLFHEVAHLCLGEPGVSAEDYLKFKPSRHENEIESFCDRFAASFLIPLGNSRIQNDLERLFRSIPPDKDEVFVAAHKYKISKYVMLGRGKDAGLISENSFWQIFKKWRDEDRPPPSSGGDAINNQISYKGKSFVALVLDALDRSKITLHEASELISLNPKHFDAVRYRIGGHVI